MLFETPSPHVMPLGEVEQQDVGRGSYSFSCMKSICCAAKVDEQSVRTDPWLGKDCVVISTASL